MKYILTMLCLMASVAVFTQGPTIPDDLRLEEAGDYGQYEGLAKKSMAWLINTPLDEHIEKRLEVNAFVMMWLAGAPDLVVNIDSDALPFLVQDENLLFTFIHGMALYQMGHPSVKDAETLHAEGLRAVARAAKQCKCVDRTKEIKKILKAERKDELVELASELLAEN